VARHRKYVQIDGKELTGVSKMPDGRFYIINNRQRVYFRDADEARAAYLASQARDMSPVEPAELMVNAHLRRAAAHEKIRKMEIKFERAGVELPVRPTQDLPSEPGGALVESKRTVWSLLSTTAG